MKKSTIKIGIILTFIVIMAGMLFNIELPLSNSDAINITMVIKSKYGSQWELISAGAIAAANEYGAELSILAPDYEKDITSQINLVRSAQNSHSDAIILAPIDVDALNAVVNEVVNKGTPVMNIVSGTTNPDTYSSLITNYVEVGQLLAINIENEIGEDGHIVIVSSEKDTLSATQKIEGIKAYIEKETTIIIDEILYIPSDIYSAERVFFEVLEKASFDGIIAIDRNATIGVGNAMRRVSGYINAVGMNLYESELVLLEEGYIDSIVDENFFAIGYLAVENSVNMANDNGFSAFRLISSHIITKENMYDEDIQKIIFPIK